MLIHPAQTLKRWFQLRLHLSLCCSCIALWASCESRPRANPSLSVKDQLDTDRQDGLPIKKCYDSSNIYFESTMPRPITARLTAPLVRENGSHRPATWDEAMDRVAAAFRKSIEKNDPRNFGMFSCSKTTNELNYAAQKFVRSVMGSNNIDSCNRT
jgi:hypothetical protein